MPQRAEDDRQDDTATSSDYLFRELAIDPPLEEFRRLYEKKIRSFELERGSGAIPPYQRAFELGEAKIRRRLGEEDGLGEADA